MLKDSIRYASFSVPQGSVIGRILYCLCIKHRPDIIQRFGLLHHSYAILHSSILQLKINFIFQVNCLIESLGIRDQMMI